MGYYVYTLGRNVGHHVGPRVGHDVGHGVGHDVGHGVGHDVGHGVGLHNKKGNESCYGLTPFYTNRYIRAIDL
jgi:hypothetical protein